MMWAKLKIAAGLAIVFAAGAACGVVGTWRFTEHAFQKSADSSKWAPMLMDGFNKELNLAPDQQEKAQVLVNQSVAEFVGLFRQLGLAVVRLHVGISEFLTPEQRAAHDAKFEEMRSDWKEKFNINFPTPDMLTNSSANPAPFPKE